MILETQRLILREMTEDDYQDLCEILQDKQTMYAYEHAFSDAECRDWLNKQFTRYRQDGFGLWAVVLKASGEMVGQCGLTMQEVNGRQVVEVGYLFKRKHWHNGYAAEAAKSCKNYAFEVLGLNEVYSIIRDNNFASQNVAKRNGMTECERMVKHYMGIDMPHIVYRIKNKG